MANCLINIERNIYLDKDHSKNVMIGTYQDRVMQIPSTEAEWWAKALDRKHIQIK